METVTHKTVWRGVEIEISFQPEYFRGMAHIEVRSVKPERAPLPITETGYRSHFMPMAAACGFDVVAWVMTGLDQAAQSQRWQRHEEYSRQGELF